jgi:hypothetical protein
MGYFITKIRDREARTWQSVISGFFPPKPNPRSKPITPQDLMATAFHVLGIDRE